MTEFAPRPTGKPEQPIALTGKLLACKVDDQPVLLHMPACDDFFLLLFSTEAGLRAMFERARAPFAKVRHVEDGLVFLASLPFTMGTDADDAGDAGPSLLRVIVDPWFTPEGRIRFLEVQRGMNE